MRYSKILTKMLLARDIWLAIFTVFVVAFMIILWLTRKSMISKAIERFLLIFIIIGVLTAALLLVHYPQKPDTVYDSYITISNFDPILEYVDVELTKQNTSIRVKRGESISGIPINLLEEIHATGYDSDKNTYNLSYTYTSITIITLYTSIGGIFSSEGYKSIEVINKSGNSVNLYTTVPNGTILYYTSPTNSSIVYIYVGQSLFLQDQSSGVTFINSEITSLTIDTSGQLSILDSIPSGTLSFKNGSNQDGYLYHNDPWEYNDSFDSSEPLYVKAGETLKDIVVYVTQEWKMSDQTSKNSSIYSVSQSDIDENLTIIFSYS